MKTPLFQLVFFLAISLSCRTKRDNFEIIGKARGFSDNTVLYLENSINAIIDSTFVKDESFRMNGYVIEPMQCVIRTKFERGADHPIQIRHLWLTDTIIIIDGIYNDFQHAKITGGIIQRQENEIEDALSQNNRTLDSLDFIFNKMISIDNKSEIDKLNLLQDSVMKVRRSIEKGFIKKHPDYFLSTYLLLFYTSTYGKSQTKELFDSLSTKMKKSKYGLQIKRYIEINREFKIGDLVVDISLPDQNGKIINLYSIQSKYLLLDFWASNCGPCRIFNTKMSENYITLKNKGLEVISVSLDTDLDNWKKSSKEDGINWVNLIDIEGQKGKIGLTFGIYYVPLNYLLNVNKEIIAKDIDFDGLNNILAIKDK